MKSTPVGFIKCSFSVEWLAFSDLLFHLCQIKFGYQRFNHRADIIPHPQQLPIMVPMNAVFDKQRIHIVLLFLDRDREKFINRRFGEGKKFLSMKRTTAGNLQALELLMRTTLGFEHFDTQAESKPFFVPFAIPSCFYGLIIL